MRRNQCDAIIIIIISLIYDASYTYSKPDNCEPLLGDDRDQGNIKNGYKDHLKFVGGKIRIWGYSLTVIDVNNGFNGLHGNTLDLQGNNIQAIRVGSFNNSTIKHLILSENHMKCLLENQLNIEGLVRLDLSNNMIIYIEYTAFPETLAELDLSHNLLREFEINDSLGNIKNLYLTGNKISEFEADKASVVRKIERLDLGYNQLQHFNFSNLKYLKFLTLKANNLDHLDSVMFQNLHNLRELDVSENELEKLDTLKNNEFPELVILDVKNNYVNHISNILFSNTGNLGELDLSGNHLEDLNLTKYNFEKLWRLKMNYMGLNRTDPSRFQNLDTLFELELSHNNILKIHPNINISTLWRFDLSYNSLTEINNNFGYLKELGSLDLSHNQITSFNIADNKLDKIWKMKLDHNELNEISDEAIPNMNFLLLLDLSNNNLKTFSISGRKLQRLRVLDLSFNNIYIYPSSPLSTLVSLRFLNLRNNVIRYVDPAAFYSQSKLYYLDISHNLLTFFKYDKKYGRSSLQNFNIFGNPINCLHLKEIEYFSYMNHIRMDICDSVGDGRTPLCVDYKCNCRYRPNTHYEISDNHLEKVPKYSVKNCSFAVLAHNGA